MEENYKIIKSRVNLWSVVARWFKLQLTLYLLCDHANSILLTASVLLVFLLSKLVDVVFLGCCCDTYLCAFKTKGIDLPKRIIFVT